MRELPNVIIILEANTDFAHFVIHTHLTVHSSFSYLDENVSKHPLRHVDPEGGGTTLFQNVGNYLPFLIKKFRSVLNVVCFLLGKFPGL
jgi:hypothetical protein